LNDLESQIEQKLEILASFNKKPSNEQKAPGVLIDIIMEVN